MRGSIIMVGLLLVCVSTQASEVCTDPTAVTLDVEQVAIKPVLRAIAEQSKLNLAVRPNVQGVVSAYLNCVPARRALQNVLAQVDATYCEEGIVVRVRRVLERSCTAAWWPSPLERVRQD